jgi:ribitol 2-dehydrogenase
VAQGLDGAVAVVTGGSSGIGRAIGQDLSARGARVVLTARSASRLEEAAATLPGPTLTVPADITDVETAGLVINSATKEFGPVDIVVANAGIYLANEVWKNDVTQIERLVSTNITGVMSTVHAAVNDMLPRHAGDVIVTSSVSGYQAIHWEPVYSASKHALRAFTDGLRRQLAGTGVRLGTIAPGVVETELWATAGETDSERLTGTAAGLRVEDVAEAVAFMLTRPRHVTVRDLVILPSGQDI